MWKLLSILLLLLASSWARAQFTDSTSYHLVMSSSGSINSTETGTAYLLNNSLNFGLKKKSIVFNNSNSWLYGKQNRNLTNNDFSSSLNFNVYKTFPHFYYWGLVNYNTSVSLKLNHQVLAGLGIAYSILDRENAYLNISNGILYDKSNLIASQTYHTYRNSFRLQYRFLLGKIFTLDGSNFIQSSFSRQNDYIIRTTNTLGIKLKQWISFTTSLSYNKLNITNSENLNFTYGLTFDKYF